MEKAELEHIQVGETDEALVTLQKLDIVDQPEVTDDEREKVKRMIDIRMMPIVLTPQNRCSQKMMITYMLQYYDKAILGQAALFNFIPDLQLSVVVSPGPPPVVSTLRFSQGTSILDWLDISFDYFLLWIYFGLLSYFSACSAFLQWKSLRSPGPCLGNLSTMYYRLLQLPDDHGATVLPWIPRGTSPGTVLMSTLVRNWSLIHHDYFPLVHSPRTSPARRNLVRHLRRQQHVVPHDLLRHGHHRGSPRTLEKPLHLLRYLDHRLGRRGPDLDGRFPVGCQILQ